MSVGGVDSPSLPSAPSEATQKKMALDAVRSNIAPKKSADDKMREAAQGFESVFLNKIISQMRSTLGKDSLFSSQAEKQFQGMYDQALADQLSKQGGIGLADMMVRQFKERQEGAKPKAELKPLRAEDRALQLKSRQASLDAGSLNKKPSLIDNGNTDYSLQSRFPVRDLSGAPSQVAAAVKSGSGSLPVLPVAGEVSSEFGSRTDPFNGQKAWHNGVDIAAAEGTPVKAAADGQVKFSGKLGGYGNVVILTHPGDVETIYGHNKSNSVAVGTNVRAGQVIGEVGSTGRSTGPHVHFEVRKLGSAINPNLLCDALKQTPRKTELASK